MKFFNEKEGIFFNPSQTSPVGGSHTIENIRADFIRENRDFTTRKIFIPESTASFPISDFKDRIKTLEEKNPGMTHLSIFYGLDREMNLRLILCGLKIDLIGNFETFIEMDDFSGPSLMCNDPTQASEMRKRFKDTFDIIYELPDTYIRGTYIRVKQGDYKEGTNTIHSVLDTLEMEGSDSLNIAFGFMDPGKGARIQKEGFACFHMIFTGRNSNDVSFRSKSTFSTFDNDPGYSGPKPSCPPFCHPET